MCMLSLLKVMMKIIYFSEVYIMCVISVELDIP